ncbi:hypothetical protein TNCT_166691 [Trichonephila clavata]|uniref:Uncharacterized protein n=1 Tax=Trichonephila clavata TaxID=2740835 RepID=A0A8X6L7T5_TRICU|nr:hypothetical protein TNCT_166691 [Trichonephila clavata]
MDLITEPLCGITSTRPDGRIVAGLADEPARVGSLEKVSKSVKIWCNMNYLTDHTRKAGAGNIRNRCIGGRERNACPIVWTSSKSLNRESSTTLAGSQVYNRGIGTRREVKNVSWRRRWSCLGSGTCERGHFYR